MKVTLRIVVEPRIQYGERSTLPDLDLGVVGGVADLPVVGDRIDVSEPELEKFGALLVTGRRFQFGTGGPSAVAVLECSTWEVG